MSKFYKLDYRHPTRLGFEEISIGFFSSLEVIEKIVDDRIVKSGFKDYPRNCFIVTEVTVDDFGWRKGFIQEPGGDIEIK